MNGAITYKYVFTNKNIKGIGWSLIRKSSKYLKKKDFNYTLSGLYVQEHFISYVVFFKSFLYAPGRSWQ